MATQNITANTTLTPYETAGEAQRQNTILPWGELVHDLGSQGSTLDAAAATGDLVVITLPLPTNFAYRLKQLLVTTKPNTGVNNWETAFFNAYWRINQGERYVNMEYPMVPDDPRNAEVRHYGIGMPSNTGKGISLATSMIQPTQLFQQVPAGVGALEPQVRLEADDVTAAGNVRVLAIWDAFNVSQRMHAIVNTEISVT